jgi:murein DD-endopeptidase MepM/ murein hydrolase activator NlpD
MRRPGAAALLALAAAAAAANEQPLPGESFGIGGVEMPRDEITPAEREQIWRDIERSRAKLALPKAGGRPAFRWPLRAARGYASPFFETISNFVDHDAAFPGKLQDYNCGARTYDLESGYNHQGIDISLWPDNWNLMAAQQVEIVAAAPGTIVFKSDGNFDRNCKIGGTTWNAVYVQHDDGSIAWYGHMKSGSVTAKAIGERVVAGEFLGNVGSSGNSIGPHLHFEVYDANQRLVDPFAGQCNTWNAQSWWESQPAYYVPHVNRVLTATAPPVFATCGSDGHVQTTGTFSEKTSFRPGDTPHFVATVRDLAPSHVIAFAVRRPDGSIWRQSSFASPGQFSAAYAYISATLEPTVPTGTWLFEAELAGTRAQVSFDVTAGGLPRPNFTDLWWNPAESGWGVNLIHQGDVIFATWFTYDTDRGGLWLVMDAARLQPDGSYTGTIYRTTGVALPQINGQPAQSGAVAVGSGTLRFPTTQQATFSYTVSGVSQQKSMTRFNFATPAPACAFNTATRQPATNYQDLWWNPSESGWGVNLSHQGDLLFATWFTYGAGGRGQWLVSDAVRRQPTGEFKGRLYRTTGTPLAQINGTPAQSGAADVGELTLTFTDGQNARLDYVVDGVAQAKALTRFVFASPQTLCR